MAVKTLLIEYDDTHGDVMGGYPLRAPAVEVVRCSDCKYCREHDMRAYGGGSDQLICHRLSTCDSAGFPVDPDGFCSYGKTKAVDA